MREDQSVDALQYKCSMCGEVFVGARVGAGDGRVALTSILLEGRFRGPKMTVAVGDWALHTHANDTVGVGRLIGVSMAKQEGEHAVNL